MSATVALISDLIFRSRIEGEARAVGASLVAVARASDAMARISAGDVRMLIVDLDLPPADTSAAIAAARAAGVDRVVAFYPHAQTQLAEAARAQGADTVLPRSAFVVRLPELLTPAL